VTRVDLNQRRTGGIVRQCAEANGARFAAARKIT